MKMTKWSVKLTIAALLTYGLWTVYPVSAQTMNQGENVVMTELDESKVATWQKSVSAVAEQIKENQPVQVVRKDSAIDIAKKSQPMVDSMDYAKESMGRTLSPMTRLAHMPSWYETRLLVARLSTRWNAVKEENKKEAELKAVGTTFTASHLQPLTMADLGLDGQSVAAVETQGRDDVLKRLSGYPFKQVLTKAGSYTIYVGPVKGAVPAIDEQGLIYSFKANAVTNIHVGLDAIKQDQTLRAESQSILYGFQDTRDVLKDIQDLTDKLEAQADEEDVTPSELAKQKAAIIAARAGLDADSDTTDTNTEIEEKDIPAEKEATVSTAVKMADAELLALADKMNASLDVKKVLTPSTPAVTKKTAAANKIGIEKVKKTQKLEGKATARGKETSFGDAQAAKKAAAEAEKARKEALLQYIIGQSTNRGIHVGSERGEMLFVYGAPQAMWQNNDNGSLLFLYSTYTPQELAEAQRLYNDTKIGQKLSKKDNGFLVFTIYRNKIVTINMIDAQVWSRFMVPDVSLHAYIPGILTADDFKLCGYRLGKTFTGNPNQSWTEKGKFDGFDFIGYNNVVIGYDDSHQIRRVMLTRSTAVTPRGVTMGDSKYLLLYLYGEPTRIVDDGKSEIMEYAAPNKEPQYLAFTIGKSDGFISGVELRDTPVKKSEK